MSKASRKWKDGYITGDSTMDIMACLPNHAYQAPHRKMISAKRYRAYKRELDQMEKIFRKTGTPSSGKHT